MKKFIQFITIILSFVTCVSHGIDMAKPSLLRSTSSLPKETQRIIAQLELDAAKATQSSFEAEEAADKKEVELKKLEEQNAQTNKKMEELTTKFNDAKKALEEAQTKQTQAIKDAIAQKNIASEKTLEASTKKKEITKLKKDAIDAKKALVSAKLETQPTQEIAKKAESNPNIAKAKQWLDIAKKYGDQLTIVLVKENIEKAQSTWSGLMNRLTDAYNTLPSLKASSNNSDIKPLQTTLEEIQQSVASLFGSLERQISLLSGDSFHELLTLYEAWGHQWIEHPLGAPAIKRNFEEFVKKMDPQSGQHKEVSTPYAHDESIAAPPAY